MRPVCGRLIRRFGDHAHHLVNQHTSDDSDNVGSKGRGYVHMPQVSGDKSAPPSPKGYDHSADHDLSDPRLRFKLEPQTIEDLQTHEKASGPLRASTRALTGHLSTIQEIHQASSLPSLKHLRQERILQWPKISELACSCRF
jgi:hypothetical protein